MEDFQQPEQKRNRPIILIWILVVAGVLITALVITLQLKNTVGDYNFSLSLAAKGMNVSCPKMLDEMTRLDSVSTRRDKIFTYHLTLTKYSKEELPNENFCVDWEENIANTLSDNEGMKEFGINGVTIVYTIKDRELNELCTATFVPDDYYSPAK